MNIILSEHGKVDTYFLKEFLSSRKMISLALARSWAECQNLLESYSYDLALLADFNDMPLETLFSESQKILSKVSVIALLPRGSSKERRVTLLNLGADDVIGEPYDFEELFAKMFSIIRRARGFKSSDIHIGAVTVSPTTSSVCINHKTIPLTKKEYMVLESLVLRKGEISTKAMLLDRLYGGINEPGDRIIDAFIWHLRKKLKIFGVKENCIETVWGQGYRIVPKIFKE